MSAEILTRDELKEKADKLKAEGVLLVFTNGCFDILHVGHIRYLKKAASLGDKLILAVNSDSSVKKLKGSNRPYVPGAERMEILSALDMIDFLVPFSEVDCRSLLEDVKPQIYVKGGDYRLEDLPEAETVYEYGGKIVFIKEVKGRSTTELVKKIRQTK
ncbi:MULTISPECIES: D-glycero-beta-D-manno-heptose 1-phosphate adenylyltransferase [unclassified Halanaerobium]|uniref:D-glycero-beta-D-manno-heptose 1-phosphate adenylyltransferase n=1 Tax=unclassified Halanaerobium TaxID=2641197 RepID=UPI000DF2499E|nr:MULTISPECIES: D-glycero-beta-D-manno-heptose 1-phosphate adenylyltransferase [unclassified Halanaerobium]RCW43817.1 rfaE bifunctional protein nucleotidyltransferase chain/domain [Halanaerobium sp. MA284_MarDTE_T2]RCW80518.1 rfaE bifunctional protein nucleotidyltransferase chain/domain [Halanaerobium sp. DL-01]